MLNSGHVLWLSGDPAERQRPAKSGTGSGAQERGHRNRQVDIPETLELDSILRDIVILSQAPPKGLSNLVPNVIVLIRCDCDTIWRPEEPAGKQKVQAILEAQKVNQEEDRKEASPALIDGTKSRDPAAPSGAHPTGLFIHLTVISPINSHIVYPASRHGKYDAGPGEA